MTAADVALVDEGDVGTGRADMRAHAESTSVQASARAARSARVRTPREIGTLGGANRDERRGPEPHVPFDGMLNAAC